VQIGKARNWLYGYAVSAEDSVNKTMDSVFHLEKSFTETIASLAPPKESGEKLMPGVIYVLVAAMAGSIVTRNRTIFLRATAPLALGIGAANYVLPNTTHNIADLAWKYEQRFPALAEAHTNAYNRTEKFFSTAKAHTQMSVQIVDDKVTDAREAIEGWVRKGK
jgi:MICOS complex subunit MIC26